MKTGSSDSIPYLYQSMMNKCYKKTSREYSNYGAKGIRVYEEWHDKDNFRDWIKSNGFFMGVRIARYDEDKDFSPSNCYLIRSKTAGIYSKTFEKKIAYYKEKYAYEKKYNIKTKNKHSMYPVYNSMKSRCYNKMADAYKYYGGKGITICDEWLGDLGFYHFLDWIESQGGYTHKNTSIDRIDSNGNYEPQNCRLVDIKTQNINRKGVYKFEINGETVSAREFCNIRHINYRLFLKMLKRGDNINTILDTLEV